MAAEFVARLGGRLREARDALDLTQEQVAQRVGSGCTGQYVSDWERGVHKPSDDYLELLAKALETTVADLLSEEPDKSVTPDLSPTQLDRIEHKLDRVLAALARLRKDRTVEQAELRDAFEAWAQQVLSDVRAATQPKGQKKRGTGEGDRPSG